MEEALLGMPFDGHIVIDAGGVADPLSPGRRIGVGRDPVDLAIDSVDGVSLVAKGLSQALSIAAAALSAVAIGSARMTSATTIACQVNSRPSAPRGPRRASNP